MAASRIRLERWKWIYLRLRDPKALPEFERARAERLDRPKGEEEVRYHGSSGPSCQSP